MVLGEEAPVDVVVLVHADGDDGEVGHLALQGEQAGQLFDAGRAPGGPEVEHDDLAAELAEVDGLCAVGHDELRARVCRCCRGGRRDRSRRRAVTMQAGQQAAQDSCYAHDYAPLPIIRSRAADDSERC